MVPLRRLEVSLNAMFFQPSACKLRQAANLKLLAPRFIVRANFGLLRASAAAEFAAEVNGCVAFGICSLLLD